MKKSTLIFTFAIVASTLLAQDSFTQERFTDLFVNTFAVADFNGDGYPDVFGVDLRYLQPSDNYLILNKADGTMGFEVTLQEEASDVVGVPAAGGYDGDGDMDIVVAKGDNAAELFILKNDGNAVFEAIPLGVSGASHLQFRDLEGDGDLDIVGMEPYSDNSISIFVNDGNQNYSAMTVLSGSDNLADFDSGDIDGDGDVDIVAGFDQFTGKQVVVYKNNGSNSFEEVVLEENNFNSLRSIAIADVNSDGQQDVVAVRSYNYNGWINQGDFTFEMTPLATYSGSNPGLLSLLISDLNGDGVSDAVAGSSDGIFAYLNTATAPLEYEMLEAGTVAPAYNLAEADFDQDGDMDFIASNGDLWWFENNIEQIVATPFITKAPLQITLYPNPAIETIQIRVPTNTGQVITSYTIIDEQGRIVLHGTGSELNNRAITIKKLMPGYYVFSAVFSSGEMGRVGFVKE